MTSKRRVFLLGRWCVLQIAVLGIFVACRSGSTESGLDGASDTSTYQDGFGPDASVDQSAIKDINVSTLDSAGKEDSASDLVVSDGFQQSNACETASVFIYTSGTVTHAGTTVGATNTYEEKTCIPDATSGSDVFYAVSLPVGKFQITLKPDPLKVEFDPALYVLSACGGNCLVGVDTYNKGKVENETLVVESTGSTYYIVVDSWSDDVTGNFSLEITKLGSTTDGGATDASNDGGVTDSTPTDLDSGDVDTDGNDGAIYSGAIVVSEILSDPAGTTSAPVSDDHGEWFEIYNAGTTAIDLKNWKFRDDGGESFVVDVSLTIQPGQFLVLGPSNDTPKNGNVTVHYAYGNQLRLANGPDEIIVEDPQGVIIDWVSYTSALPWNRKGISTSLKTPADSTIDNNDKAHWCVETTPWGVDTDKGTPGAAPKCP